MSETEKTWEEKEAERDRRLLAEVRRELKARDDLMRMGIVIGFLLLAMVGLTWWAWNYAPTASSINPGSRR